MKHLIDKAAVVAEIKKLKDRAYELYGCSQFDTAYNRVLEVINTLEVKEEGYHCDENRDKELALSLQIQAYLNTASDELYAQGKPLYSKSHLEGIHECMKMWVKLHDYYFYKHTYENKKVDFDKEIDNIWNPRFNLGWDEKSLLSMNHEGFTTIAKHFFELGLKSKGE